MPWGSGCLVLLMVACSGPGETNESRGNDERGVAADSSVSVLKVGAVYNDAELQLRFVYKTDDPSWYHQYLVYQAGEWVRYGSGSEGRDPDGFYEDRISVMWDDGSVEGFSEQGGYVTIHQGVRGTRSAVDSDVVQSHPWFGQARGRSDIRKFIAESRAQGDDPDTLWNDVLSEEELLSLRENGVFLDLWQWRSHRSHPVGYADNGYVLDYRNSAAGRSMYTDNRDPDTGLPLMMYDPEATGMKALSYQALLEGAYDQDDRYYLSKEHAVPFDPEHEWQEGDALPWVYLREPEGSRGAIRSEGDYRDGAWRIRLTRSLEAPDPLDSKAFVPGKAYTVAFAVHSAAGTRHHEVSLPITLGLDTDARIVAHRVEGDLNQAEVRWTEITLFDPGDPTRKTSF